MTGCCGLRDVDCGMWNTEYELRKGRATSLMAGCGLRDAGCGMWNTEYESCGIRIGWTRDG